MRKATGARSPSLHPPARLSWDERAASNLGSHLLSETWACLPRPRTPRPHDPTTPEACGDEMAAWAASQRWFPGFEMS